MPRYDFVCQNCGVTFEVICASDQQQAFCVHCPQIPYPQLADRQLSAPASIHIH